MSSAILLCEAPWFNNPQENVSQVAIDKQDFVTAFSLYAIFYESMVFLIWLCRGKSVPMDLVLSP
jgi:hypothetical protein